MFFQNIFKQQQKNYETCKSFCNFKQITEKTHFDHRNRSIDMSEFYLCLFSAFGDRPTKTALQEKLF